MRDLAAWPASNDQRAERPPRSSPGQPVSRRETEPALSKTQINHGELIYKRPFICSPSREPNEDTTTPAVRALAPLNSSDPSGRRRRRLWQTRSQLEPRVGLPSSWPPPQLIWLFMLCASPVCGLLRHSGGQVRFLRPSVSGIDFHSENCFPPEEGQTRLALFGFGRRRQVMESSSESAGDESDGPDDDHLRRPDI